MRNNALLLKIGKLKITLTGSSKKGRSLQGFPIKHTGAGNTKIKWNQTIGKMKTMINNEATANRCHMKILI